MIYIFNFTGVACNQVVFATPGMLHAGQSLNLFKSWAEDEKNMVCGMHCLECNRSYRTYI